VDKIRRADHIFPTPSMKLFLPLLLACALPALAAKQTAAINSKPPPAPAKGKPGLKATTATTLDGATKPSAGDTPTPAATASKAPTGNVTLDSYIQALSDGLTLSKDEKTDIKTYYLDDGSKLQQILNDASLSPLQQTQQVDDLRDTRNAKIEALLRDVDRQAAFLKTEADYRVSLTELAANGALVPSTKQPNVPEPTATPPSQAEKTEKPGSPPSQSQEQKSP
jgi:hypothetical protein